MGPSNYEPTLRETSMEKKKNVAGCDGDFDVRTQLFYDEYAEFVHEHAAECPQPCFFEFAIHRSGRWPEIIHN